MGGGKLAKGAEAEGKKDFACAWPSELKMKTVPLCRVRPARRQDWPSRPPRSSEKRVCPVGHHPSRNLAAVVLPVSLCARGWGGKSGEMSLMREGTLSCPGSMIAGESASGRRGGTARTHTPAGTRARVVCMIKSRVAVVALKHGRLGKNTRRGRRARTREIRGLSDGFQ